jgi:glycosyltransferase involved in cell wall biosynthesis
MTVKILLLSRYGRLGASSRLRSYQYVAELNKSDIDVEIAPLLSDEYLQRFYKQQPVDWFQVCRDYVNRVIKLSNASTFDLLWIEKEIFPNLPGFAERILNLVGVRYILDYDDAIFHYYDLSANVFKRTMKGKIDAIMRGAALVICGNEYLVRRAHLAGAKRVELIPTVIDLRRYGVVAREGTKEAIVVGWIGTPHTSKYLNLVLSPLRTLSGDFPLVLRVIGGAFSESGVTVECSPWSEDTEVQEIQQLDIGIMPLVDSPWERGKCGYKLIQYMGCGLPVVASPVGANCQIVEESVNGYLADSPDAWLRALRRLCSNAKLRRQMGLKGRESVESRYCLQKTAPKLAAVLHEIVRNK